MAAKKKPVKVKNLCLVCLEEPQVVMGICDDCDTSFEEALGKGASTIQWCANRARLFEQKRMKKAQK